jgi:hypothetical protein
MANQPLILMINIGNQEQGGEGSPLERALRGEEEESEILSILKMMLVKMPMSGHAGGA